MSGEWDKERGGETEQLKYAPVQCLQKRKKQKKT